jgi:hypothetical protein
MIRVDLMDAFYRLSHFLRGTELVVNKNTADHENVSLQLDFTYRF